MLKYFILIINSFALFFYNIFVGDGVSITAKFPENVKPGSEYTTEVSIKKGSVSGFAKLQFDIPSGITIKEMDSKGGAFTFETQSLKYIWTALPADEEITIKFNVIVDATASGEKIVAGKFSYITNNVKQQVTIDPIKIMVEGASAATTTTTPAVDTPAQDSVAKQVSTPLKDSLATIAAGVPDKPADNLKQAPANDVSSTEVACTRTIVNGEKTGHYKVQIAINKQDIKGFAKLVETLPANFKATSLKTNGSSFAVVDNKAKFVWVSLPKDEQLHIEYEVVFSQTVDPSKLVEGEFSYLENDQSKKVKTGGDQSFKTGTSVVAVDNSNPGNTSLAKKEEPVTPVSTTTEAVNTTKTEDAGTTNVATTTTEEKKEEKKNEAEKTVTPTEPVFSSANSLKQGNVNYAVQIGAYKSNFNQQYYVKKYGITENIRTDMHEGYTKCIIGNFNEYKMARDQRETIKVKGISGAFVTAYNTGKRITVQEALMISNQKWFR